MEHSNPSKAAKAAVAGVSPKNLAATPIYDLQSYEVQALADVLRRSQPDDRGYVQAAHRLAKLDHKPEFFGRLLFNLLYAGKPIRRIAE